MCPSITFFKFERNSKSVKMGVQQPSIFASHLTAFGQSLKCSEEFYKEGKKLAQRVFVKLQQESKYSVAEVYFCGSFGKKTDVIEPDLDLVVVCNKVDPPLADVLDDFEDILMMHEDELRIQPGPFKKTERSLNFSFKNGIEVDLLPAANIADIDEIRSKIKKDPKNAYYYNPSFVDKQVEFLTSQDSFTHTLIRLVKYWFKNLYFGESFSGGSAMMELLCCAVAEEEKKYPSLCMLRAFAKVLDTIGKLDSLKLAFRSVGERKWERVPVNELNQGGIVPAIVGTAEILGRNCFMVDPANPFQDFLEQKPTVMSNFKKFASSTRQILSQLVDRNHVGNDFTQMLFQPFPTSLVNLDTLLPPNGLCISTIENYSSIVCDMKIKKDAVMKDVKKKDAIEVLKMRLLSAVNAVVTTNPDKVKMNDVQNAVESSTKTSLQVNLVTGTERHNEMDVTLTIPYRIKDQGYAVRFSMSWK